LKIKFLVILGLLVWQTSFALTPSIPPVQVRPEHSGSWYNPEQSGHGFSIEVISQERSIAFWYTYDQEGKPIFLFADGTNIENEIQATVYYFEGMIWGEFEPDDNQRQEWGTLEIEFHDCQNATLTYNPTMPGFSAGEMPLFHLASNEHLRCGESPMVGFYSVSLINDEDRAYIPAWGILGFDGRLKVVFGPDSDLFFDADLSFTGVRDGSATLNGHAAFIEEDSFTIVPMYIPGWFNPDMINVYFNTARVEMRRYTGLTATHIDQIALTGDWRLEMSGSGNTRYDATVESDGSFQFTDGSACLWVGQMTVSKPGFALLDVEAQPTGCDSPITTQRATGIYMRQGLYEDFDSIRVAFFNMNTGPLYFDLIRVPAMTELSND
jgi:hypothetical protein